MTTFIMRHGAPLFAALAVLAHPARAQQDDGHCRYVQAAKVPLHYVGDPLLPSIDSTINGKPAVMLFSTGAYANLLTMTGAVRHHLPLSADRDKAVSATGTTPLYRAQVDSFSVGPSHTGSIKLDAMRDSASPLNDGVIGAGYLFQADLEIALADKQIKFFNPSGSACDDAFLAYWDPNAVVVRTAPARYNHQNPHFTVELNGQSFDAVISSGAPHSYIDRAAANRAGAKFDPAASTGQQSTSARFDTLSIGTETIANPQFDVIALRNDVGADVNLGADFLRTHRVLFARHQKKLYISYVGGTPFGHRKDIEPWMQQEADAGNRDAELALARAYSSAGDAGRAQASAWLYKAAAHGQPVAAAQVGRSMMASGRYAEAATYLRRAVDELPSDRMSALSLYLVRVRMGDTEQARRELAQLVPPPDEQGQNFLAAFFIGEERPWPLPIADYYLGRIDAETLLAQAAKQSYAELRVREAKYFVEGLRVARAGSAGGKRPDATAAKPETVLLSPPPQADPVH